MPRRDKLTQAAIMKAPPMLWGRIRWHKSIGSPVGDATTGFRVQAEEHTATQFRFGPGGPEPIPGTGVWRAAVTVPCTNAPDQGDMRVVSFHVRDVHLNTFPDGKYRVRADLTGNWSDPLQQVRMGYRRIEPLAFYVVLTVEQHLQSVDFEVVYEPWRWRP